MLQAVPWTVQWACRLPPFRTDAVATWSDRVSDALDVADFTCDTVCVEMSNSSTSVSGAAMLAAGAVGGQPAVESSILFPPLLESMAHAQSAGLPLPAGIHPVRGPPAPRSPAPDPRRRQRS